MEPVRVQVGKRVLQQARDLALELRRDALLETRIARLGPGDAGRPGHAANTAESGELAGEAGEQREERQPLGGAIFCAVEPARESGERLSRLAGADRVEDFPDVLLAAIFDLALDLGAADRSAAGERGELAVLGREPLGRVRLDRALLAAPAHVLRAQRAPRQLGERVLADLDPGLARELLRQAVESGDSTAAARRLELAGVEERVAPREGRDLRVRIGRRALDQDQQMALGQTVALEVRDHRQLALADAAQASRQRRDQERLELRADLLRRGLAALHPAADQDRVRKLRQRARRRAGRRGVDFEQSQDLEQTERGRARLAGELG